MNKVETGVFIKHRPSGLATKCGRERTQGMNRKIGMEILRGKVVEFYRDKHLKERKQGEKDGKGIMVLDRRGWGGQIRNYLLNPQKLVKDLRGSKWESPDVEGFLAGDSAIAQECTDFIINGWVEELRKAEDERAPR